MVPGSSAVEQPAVNRLVAGSNPARGASSFKHLAIRSQHLACCRYGIGTLLCRLLFQAPTGEPRLRVGASNGFVPPFLYARMLSMRGGFVLGLLFYLATGSAAAGWWPEKPPPEFAGAYTGRPPRLPSGGRWLHEIKPQNA